MSGAMGRVINDWMVEWPGGCVVCPGVQENGKKGQYKEG